MTSSKILHIATLGLFANQRVHHVLVRRKADKIAIIYTEKNMDEVGQIRDQYKAQGIEVISEKVNPFEFNEILTKILGIVAEHPDYKLEFNVSCGTKVMTSAAHMAALLTDSPVYFVDSEGDEIGEMRKLQPLSISVLTPPKRRILEELVEKGGTVEAQKELGTRMLLKAASISRHLNNLEAAGYIARGHRVHGKSISITDLGRAVLRIKQIRKQSVWGGKENAPEE